LGRALLPRHEPCVFGGDPHPRTRTQPEIRQMTEPMVRFEKVTKRYGPLTVLDELDLDVARGEKVAVIGPSGSGKTTVLRMLMTLETINSGVISVEGEPLTHMKSGGGLVPASKAHLRRVRAK